MIIAMGVMLVTSLLLAATFLATQGDIRLSHTDTAQKEAYYAALAGVQEFEYEMQVNPNYWQTCGEPTNKLPQESSSSYKVKIMPAKSAPQGRPNAAPPIHLKRRSNRPAPRPTRSASNRSATPARARKSNTRSSPRSKSRDSSTSSTTRTTRTRTLRCHNASRDMQRRKYILSRNVGMRTDSCSRAEIQSRSDAHQRRPLHRGAASFGRKGHTPPDVVEFYQGLNVQCGGTGKYYTRHQKLHKRRIISGTAQKRQKPGNIRKRRRQILRRHQPRTRRRDQ